MDAHKHCSVFCVCATMREWNETKMSASRSTSTKYFGASGARKRKQLGAQLFEAWARQPVSRREPPGFFRTPNCSYVIPLNSGSAAGPASSHVPATTWSQSFPRRLP